MGQICMAPVDCSQKFWEKIWVDCPILYHSLYFSIPSVRGFGHRHAKEKTKNKGLETMAGSGAAP
jgi:hypothetical protein